MLDLSQIDTGIPLLDKYGVKATFYISPESMLKQSDQWKMAVLNGHEIGNHSVYHPCSGNFAWSRDKALEEYSLQKMRTELDSANRFINEILGVISDVICIPVRTDIYWQGGRGTKLCAPYRIDV